MGDPDPRALRDAATSIADQARATRQAVVDDYRRVEMQRKAEYDEATVKLTVAKEEVKAREQQLTYRQKDEADRRHDADEYHKRALAAEQAGNADRATELREAEAIERTRIDTAHASVERDAKAVTDARVALAERQGDADAANRKYDEVNATFAAAEDQLDAMEKKATMLDQASRKLELAPTVENPVDRAAIELDAEKLIKDANALTIDTAALTKVTGQELQLPDTTALPTVDTTSSSDTGTTDATSAGAATETDTVAAGISADAKSTDVVGGPTDDASAQPTSSDGGALTGAAPAHLGDEFAVAAATDPSTTAAPDQADLVTGADPRPGVEPLAAPAPATAGPLDDPLGVAAGPVAGTAPADPGQQADAAPASDVLAPLGGVADNGAATPDPGGAAADLTADPGASIADSFTDFSQGAPADDASATATDDVDA